MKRQSAFASSTNNPHKKKNRNQKTASKFTFKCHNCRQAGHRRADCKKLKSGNTAESRDTKPKQANLASKGNEEGFCFSAVTEAASSEPTTWILDSGASEHLVNNANLLSNKRSLLKPIKIRVAKSGIELKARYIGKSEGKVDVNRKQKKIFIQDVLYVPGLQFNLLSVPKLEMKRYKILFEIGKGTISKNNKVAAVANRNHRVYELNITNCLYTANNCSRSRNLA